MSSLIAAYDQNETPKNADSNLTNLYSIDSITGLEERKSFSGLRNYNSIVGFQNPAFNQPFDINNFHIEQKENDYIIDAIGTDNIEQQEARLQHNRSRNSIFMQDIDILVCSRVFSFKARTYINFKKSIVMIKPFIVLIIMTLIVFFVFKIDAVKF